MAPPALLRFDPPSFHNDPYFIPVNLRYMTDHAKMAPLGVANRMVNTCDMLMALIPLLDNPPWVRRHKGKTQKFEQNKWATVEKTERLRLTKLDGQVWKEARK